ncbi:MAG: GNAT family N-acetyltransferase [Alphaproteobacteria bacterium]|nr:GNAT family N-acetyltransferase [Alphaproteobacteria bacterium]
MNPEDYKLIPLDEVAADPALKASYMEMLTQLYQEYKDAPQRGRFVLNDITEVFHTPDSIENNFGCYCDFMNYRGKRSGTYHSAIDCVLVNKRKNCIVGEAGIFIRPYEDQWGCSGYDVIHPEHRGQGLGKLIMALRMDYAARVFDARTMHFWVSGANERSVNRIEVFRKAGMAKDCILRHWIFIISSGCRNVTVWVII